ncbi:MAG TPA: multidrug transporter subunit MdtA, partial [Solibacterales bacterium]|nr:multidrug transporter subunit MdtA [Bryobacterales bacterium]
RDNVTKLSTGVLDTIDNQIDPQTGTSKLKAIFANNDNMLFPQQFVNARLLLDTEHDKLLIPTAAIQRGQQGTFVYLIRPDDTVEIRKVELGITEGEDTVAESGLEPGDRVVTEGSDKLQTGSRVIIAGQARRGAAARGGDRDRAAHGGKAGGGYTGKARNQ